MGTHRTTADGKGPFQGNLNFTERLSYILGTNFSLQGWGSTGTYYTPIFSLSHFPAQRQQPTPKDGFWAILPSHGRAPQDLVTLGWGRLLGKAHPLNNLAWGDEKRTRVPQPLFRDSQHGGALITGPQVYRLFGEPGQERVLGVSPLMFLLPQRGTTRGAHRGGEHGANPKKTPFFLRGDET